MWHDTALPSSSMCHLPWGLISSVCPHLTHAQACLLAHLLQMGGTVGGHWQRQMCLFSGDKMLYCHRWQCLGANGSLWHCCHIVEPGHLDRQSWLTFGARKVEKKIKMFIMKLLEFQCKQQSFWTWGAVFITTWPHLASELTMGFRYRPRVIS